MHLRHIRAVPVVLALLGAACVPAPSGNEINFSDEGMRNGVAAARGLAGVTLDRLEIGKSLNDDNTIKDRADSFQPTDMIHASMRVSGSANSGLLRAIWRNEKGQVVQEDTRIVTPSRSDIVGLEARPQKWAGRYQVDVFLDSRFVASKPFTVAGSSQAPGSQQGVPSADPTRH